jgi:peptidoglycan/LPS O-acetylase OafA/YrhL
MTEARLRYQPGLDGLRAIALVAMLAFHDGRLNGGFLGLSTFFTLSGFLITGLLLSEYGSAGRVSLKRFFGRRSRRLLPAALIGLVLAALVTAALHDGQTSRNFRFDALSSLAEVANWRFLVSGRAYANLLATPSPLLHYWSLAVEEQFYFVLAPLIVGLLALTRGRKSILAGALALLAAVSFVDGWIVVRHSIDRAYYGTDTRALEFLIGALLAVVMSGRVLNGVQSKIVGVIGPFALMALAYGTVVTHVTDVGLFRGFLLVFSFGNAIVVLAACEPGPVRWLCSLLPLRLLGQISYGVYIYHWPVFIWMTHARTGLGPLALTGARMLTTVGLAILSYVLVEQPIRHRRAIVGGTRWIALPAATSFVAAIALLVGAAAPPLAATFSPAVSQASVLEHAKQELAAPATAPVATRRKADGTPAPVARRSLERILVVGDSVALTLGRGIERWGAQHGVSVLNDGVIGCPLLNGVDVRGYWGVATRSPDPCQTHRTWPKYLSEFKPDLVIVLYGAWDVYDASFDGGHTWVSPGQPKFDTYYAGRVADASERLRASGARVLWLTPPCFAANDATTQDPNAVWYDPARVDVLRTIDHNAAAGTGVTVSDVVHARGCPVDPETRPDGVHYTDTGADLQLQTLAPVIVKSAR